MSGDSKGARETWSEWYDWLGDLIREKWYEVFTQEVPDEDILKESGWFEAVLENLLQSLDQAVLPTEEEGQAASLRTTTRTFISLEKVRSLKNRTFQLQFRSNFRSNVFIETPNKLLHMQEEKGEGALESKKDMVEAWGHHGCMK